MNKLAVASINSKGQLVRSRILPKRQASLKREANYTCQLCKHIFPEDKLEIDHTFPASRGGNDDDTNLQVLCHYCNNKKRSQDRTQPLKGIQIRFRLGDIPRWSYAKFPKMVADSVEKKGINKQVAVADSAT